MSKAKCPVTAVTPSELREAIWRVMDVTGLNQTDIATITQCSRSFVTHLGHGYEITPQMVRRIEAAMDCSITEFVREPTSQHVIERVAHLAETYHVAMTASPAPKAAPVPEAVLHVGDRVIDVNGELVTLDGVAWVNSKQTYIVTYALPGGKYGMCYESECKPYKPAKEYRVEISIADRSVKAVLVKVNPEDETDREEVARSFGTRIVSNNPNADDGLAIMNATISACRGIVNLIRSQQ